MGLFDNLLAPFSAQPQQNAANAQIQGLQAGQSAAAPLLQAGAGAIQNYGANALAPLTQNYSTATQGTNQLASLLGFGPGGSAGIQNTLANLPGYQFTLNQGTQNVDRNAAATGSLNSGNTDKAVADYTTGLANQTYQSAVNNLQPFWTGAQNTGGQIAGVNQNIGNALAGNYTQQAGLGFGTQAGIGNANAQAALAPATAGANIWGAAGNLAKGLVSPLPTVGNTGAAAPTVGGALYGGAKSLFGNIFGS
jgi:hypothetical protein